jgi:urease accessory protein
MTEGDMKKSLLYALTVAVAACASPAFAHTGVGATHGFSFGFAHPFGGVDHILAMIAVGTLGVRLGGRAIWGVPAIFITLMTVGAGLGVSDVPIAIVQAATYNSVIFFGVMSAAKFRTPMLVAVALTGTFAVFHGLAHGVDAPFGAEGLTYAIGLIAATAFCHALGIFSALAILRFAPRSIAAYTRL